MLTKSPMCLICGFTSLIVIHKVIRSLSEFFKVFIGSVSSLEVKGP